MSYDGYLDRAIREHDAPVTDYVPTDERPQCWHIHGCAEREGLEFCDGCDELICAKHMAVCAEPGCSQKVCASCRFTGVTDDEARCYEHHRQRLGAAA